MGKIGGIQFPTTSHHIKGEIGAVWFRVVTKDCEGLFGAEGGLVSLV